MCGLESGGDTLDQPLRGLEGERSTQQDGRKRFPIDIFHREIGPAKRGVDREDVIADDCLVIEIMQRGRFFPEHAESGVGFGEVGTNELDCHHVAGLDGVAFIDFAHAASSDGFVDFKDAVELRPGRNNRPRRSKARSLVRHCVAVAFAVEEGGKTMVEPCGA